jgi:hypothetical protein
MRERAHEGKRESRMSARTTALGLNATAAAGRSYVPRDSPTAGARVAALSGVEPRSGTVADDPRCQQTDAGHGGDRAFRRRRVLGPVGTLVCLAATRKRRLPHEFRSRRRRLPSGAPLTTIPATPSAIRRRRETARLARAGHTVVPSPLGAAPPTSHQTEWALCQADQVRRSWWPFPPDPRQPCGA